jgi:hypothetical protein
VSSERKSKCADVRKWEYLRQHWSLHMPDKAIVPEGKQVMCWTGEEGWYWFDVYDALPSVVRRRLAYSDWNICPTCLWFDASWLFAKPTIPTYLKVIDAIEHILATELQEEKDDA